VAIAHLFDTDDHADAMSARRDGDAESEGGNVIQLHGSPASSDDYRLRSALITAGRSTAVQ